MKSKLAVLLVVIIAVAYAQQLSVASADSHGSAPCVSGHTATSFGFWTWPANSNVSVYLRQPDFSEAEVAAVRISARNWDESAVENGSHVHFNVRGLTSETKTAIGDMTLIRGDVYDKKLRHLALLQAHSLKVDQMISYAVIVVDVRVKNPEVLTNVMAHEIGHTLGLLDCPNCSNRSTAMGLMGARLESNGIEGPTACDKETVVAAYRDLQVRGARLAAAISLNRPVVEEGEEPEADDTPVVHRP
jgi:predicted Zn-dependent protease